MKIIVYGAGYVGLSNGLLLSRKNDVTIVDINSSIIDNLKKGVVHIDDDGCRKEIVESSAKFELVSKITPNNFNIVIIALPTNYDSDSDKFDTKSIDDLIDSLSLDNFGGEIIIKSTIPIGYSSSLMEKYKKLNIIFSPEFLREGKSFEDSKKPSRIIFGYDKKNEKPENLWGDVTENSAEVLYMSTTEAEAVKLFSNTYLAMRVAFVNELASFSSKKGISSKNLIKGVSLDKRIGDHYFAPSVGYGGYCLPKDSKQLKMEFENNGVFSDLLPAIVNSNRNRKEFIVSEIIKYGAEGININGIGHKPGVTNFRNSPKLEIAGLLRDKGIKVNIVDGNFMNKVIDGFEIKGNKKTNFVDLEKFI